MKISNDLAKTDIPKTISSKTKGSEIILACPIWLVLTFVKALLYQHREGDEEEHTEPRPN